MDRAKKRGTRVFVIFFLVFLAVFSAANLWHERQPLLQELRTFDIPGIQKDVTELNAVMEENILGRYTWIDAYGAVQRALGKHEQNAFESVIDRSGYLHGGNFWNGFGDDQKEIAVRLRRMADAMAARGTKVGFVLTPMKVARPDQRYPGIPYNDWSILSQALLRWLDYYGVPYLDLTELQQASGLSYEEFWFRTDHHWTPRAAFAGYQALVDWMNSTLGARLDPQGYYRDPDHYELTVYPKAMFGSQGRDAGLLFAGGMEDYIAVTPRPDGKEYVWKSEDETMSAGTFR